MGYKLIASDMDETLLNDEHEICQRNIDFIKKAKELGVKFVPATGRGYASIQRDLKILGLCDELGEYVISFNGGALSENKDNRLLDFQGWLEDCLGETDMRGDALTLLRMCDDLLDMFSWPEYTGSDIRFLKSSALKQLGKKEESAKFCKDWIQKEPENIVAATAGVYAYIDTKEYGEAEKLVNRFIFDKSECFEENEIMFTAASKLYGAMNKKKEKRQVDKAIREYEEYLEECFLGMENDEDDEEWFDELPFN